ncbi:phytanoyl-CoA dioxygenase family protein [Caulobacter sp. ErkDOM-YI]|uniref:phytanoyl-CoA dioxygenase family protein n=1 Tax=unclassified Caulobacter TaxID=2648921 RepID=UPI003AF7B898
MTVSQKLLPGVPLIESMLFAASLDDMGLSSRERDIALQLNEKGFAVFDFPDEALDQRIERIIAALTPEYDLEHYRTHGEARKDQRVQDAWRTNEDVRAIAANTVVTDLLSRLYGRRAFPFQTLNFPVGTQQHIHSDSIHFSSIPERFMCGVWLAMEDIHPDAGPLVYYPGSHKWPIVYNDMIGKVIGAGADFMAQKPYEDVWDAMVEASGAKPELFQPQKGQALIWAANLLHGGSRQNDPTRTRWSQVTHYYFDDCAYYTPAFSDPLMGNLDLRQIVDITTGQTAPNIYVDRPVEQVERRAPTVAAAQPAPVPGKTPPDFDPQRYLALNPDVAAARVDARKHYLRFGIRENRRYK